MTNRIDVAAAAQKLLNADNILILCHKNPDGDTIGSAAALQHSLTQIGKKSAIMCNDPIPPMYDYLKPYIFQNRFEPQFVVAADVASRQLLGENTAPYNENVDLCIDHHGSNTGFANMVCCYEDYPATAQLMFQLIELMGVQVNGTIADCLFTGIVTDTGCFKYSSTLSTTHAAAAKLIEAGAQHSMICEKFFISKSKKKIELEKFALSTLEFYFDDRCAVITLTEDILNKINPEPTDIDGISAMARAIDGVDIGVTLRQIGKNAFKISFRTSENTDASQLAQGFGGGGHKRAAGCEVIGSLESAKKAILKEVECALCR